MAAAAARLFALGWPEDGKRGYLVDLSRNREGPRGADHTYLHQLRPHNDHPSAIRRPSFRRPSRCCSSGHSPSHRVSTLERVRGTTGGRAMQSHAG